MTVTVEVHSLGYGTIWLSDGVKNKLVQRPDSYVVWCIHCASHDAAP